MCELLAMSSLRSTQLALSFQALAAHSGGASTTRDGWGVAFYQGNDVALFREPVAASDSPLVQFLQSQGPETSLALSHIRHATRGVRSLANTQPFVRELGGRTHVFAHNGNLPGVAGAANLAFDHHRPVGTTDSEHAFCSLLERLHDPWRAATMPPPLEQRWSVILEFAADLCKLGPANFFYSDGEVLFAHGHRRIQADGKIAAPGLWLWSCHCADQGDPVHASGVTVAPGFQEMVLLASVPLTDEPWSPLAEGELVAVSAGRLIRSSGPDRVAFGGTP
jgi:predicted glutamine amidotransferase